MRDVPYRRGRTLCSDNRDMWLCTRVHFPSVRHDCFANERARKREASNGLMGEEIAQTYEVRTKLYERV